MKNHAKQLAVIALAVLAALVLLVSCTDPDNGEPQVDIAALGTAIDEANALRAATVAAASEAEVEVGVFWVTQAVMDTFAAAITMAEAVYDNPASQEIADATVTTLNAARGVFNEARSQRGIVGPVNLSGTVIFTGAEVSYVFISAEYEDEWGNRPQIGWTDFQNPVSGTAWSIEEAENTRRNIRFQVQGHTRWGSFVRMVYPDPPIAGHLHQTGIVLDLGNISPVTLSGTISATLNGNPFPHVGIAAILDQYERSTNQTSLSSPGNNAPWSLNVAANSGDIRLRVSGYVDAGGSNLSTLFYKYLDQVFTVSDQDISGITLDIGNFESVTLSGTVTFHGAEVNHMQIDVFSQVTGNHLGFRLIMSPTNGDPWSIEMPVYSGNVRFTAGGFNEQGNSLFHREIQPDQPITGDQSRSDIELELGDITQ